MHSTAAKKQSLLRRILKGVLVAGLCVVGLALVLVALLLVAPVRTQILHRILPRITESLPGDLTVSRAAWPALGSLQFAGVSWEADGVSVLSADTVSVAVRVWPLLRRDIKMEHLVVHGLSVDVPTLSALMVSNDTAATADERKSKSGGFLRQGSVPGLPSISVDLISVTAPRLRISPDSEIADFALGGEIDLSLGGHPGAHVDRLTLRGSGEEWWVDDLRVAFDLGEGVVSGSGSGGITPQLPFFLTIEPLGPDKFAIKIVTDENHTPPDNTGILAVLTLAREGTEVSSLAYDITVKTPGTDELLGIPQIAAQVERIPRTNGVTLTVSGSVAMEPEIAARAHCKLHNPEWLDSGVAAVRYEDRTVHLDSLAVTLADISISASGYMSPDSVSAAATIDLSGSEGVKLLAPQTGVPDSLEATIGANIALAREAQALNAIIGAQGRIGAFTLDGLRVDADIALDKERTSTIRLEASGEGCILSTVAEIKQTEDVTVRIEPLAVLAVSGEDTLGRGSRGETGTVTYSPEAKKLTLDGVEVVGALGDIRLDGYLEGNESGRFQITGGWPEPPFPLLSKLGDSRGLTDSLRASWSEDGPFSLSAEGTLSSAGDEKELDAAVSFTLPGPRTLAPLLPDGADVSTLGPIAGDIEFRSEVRDTMSSFGLVVDLARTEWIDTSAIRVSGEGRSVSIDSFFVRAEELEVALRGDMDAIERAGEVNLTLSDSGFLRRRLSPSVPDIDLAVEGSFSIATEHPEIDASLEGSIRGSGYHIPSITATLTQDEAGASASIRAPSGVLTDVVRLERVEVDYTTSDISRGPLPATIKLAAIGNGFEFRQDVSLEADETIVCTVEELEVLIQEAGLKTERPFRVTLDQASGGISIEEMHLAGALGSVDVDGVAGTDSVDIQGTITIDLPSSPPRGISIPEVLWPDRIDTHLHAPARHTLELDATVEGLALDDGSEVIVELRIAGSRENVRSRLAVNDGRVEIVGGELSLPASITIYPPALEFHEGDVSLEMKLQGYPMAVRTVSGKPAETTSLVARINADLLVSGPPDEPRGHVSAVVSFPGWPEMSDFSVSAEGALRPDSLGDPALASRVGDLSHRIASSLGIDRTESLIVAVLMNRGDSILLEGGFSYPLGVTFAPWEISTTDDGTLNALVKSRALPLEEFDLLLPVAVGLDGICTVDLSASGPVHDPLVSGSLKATDLRIQLADLARVLLDGEARVEGTARRPSIIGEFRAESGNINIPQPPPDLHPAEGEAILLASEWRRSIDSDTLVVATEDSLIEAPPDGPPFEPDYDITLDIPSGFWLRGEGIEIELRGKLQVVKKDAQPVIAGSLDPLRGSFLFLGRNFELERGLITFYGTKEINPSLDITLTSSIEGTKVWVNLTGTLEEPRLQLTSKPDMSEGDIMATILFGKPLDRLSDGQYNMLRDRATDILLAMGAARLQQQLAGQYGIDVVAVRGGSGRDQESVLAVGKYLTPKILVTYEQGLGQKSPSHIVMEYLLHRSARLKTMHGNDGRASIGVSLQKDY